MLTNIIVALLGLFFVTLQKMQSVKKDFEVANKEFVLKKFFSSEIIGILMSLTAIAIMAFTVKEWIGIKPQFENYVTIIFAMGGAIGSWAFLLILGTSRKYIRKVVDEKTNELDSMKVDTSNFPDTSSVPKSSQNP
jgi:hypothetical protein